MAIPDYKKLSTQDKPWLEAIKGMAEDMLAALSPGKYGRSAALEEIKAFLAQPAVAWPAKDKRYDELLNDLQANILKHHNKAFSEYLFITFHKEKKQEVKDWLSRFSQKLTSAGQQLQRGHLDESSVLCLYLTWSGYEYLGIPEPVRPQGLAFRMGLRSRVRLDTGQPEAAFADTAGVHAVILYACTRKPAGPSQFALDFKNDLAELAGLEQTPHFIQRGAISNPLPKAYHFKEGISNPRFFPGVSPARGIRPLKAAEIAPLDLVLTQDRGGNGTYSYGSYGAFMKLHINAEAIQRLEDTIIEKTAIGATPPSRDFIRAWITGRFADGTPLTLSDRPARQATNDFDFTELIKIKRRRAVQDDRSGARCPFHAHIRKANPRLPETQHIRIARRGVFYDEGDAGKGLLFLSFQNSLENQFEHILNNWMLDGHTHRRDEDGQLNSQNSGVDMLFCRANDEYALPAEWNGKAAGKSDPPPPKITVAEPIVTFRGGLYFFAPAKSFFYKLVRQVPDLSRRLGPAPPKPHFVPGSRRYIKAVPKGEESNPLFIKGTQVRFKPAPDLPDNK